MKLGTLTCDVEGCSALCVEQDTGHGWPGWGMVNGLRNSEGGATEAYLCPDHLAMVATMINGSGPSEES